MTPASDATHMILLVLFVACQLLYALTFLVDLYHFTRPVNLVQPDRAPTLVDELPRIVLFYPVLRELEGTMRTTFGSISRLDYPVDRYRLVAVPNHDDLETIASLKRLQGEFPKLEILETPPTTDLSWSVVWRAWSENTKAYWWHSGARTRDRDLPPKKTRQLIYAFYTVAADEARRGDFLVNYIDADSCPPRDHFMAAAAGMQDFDVLQSQNVAGNLNDSFAASLHAFDHMAWDGMKYPHLSADGRHPYWMLGKGLFFRAHDLIDLGGFHPWITIEDPEVGMRFWKNGKRLGIIENSLIEEVPLTFGRGVTQRKRWVAGFFQSLGEPLRELGFTRAERFKAWLNFLPCLSLWVNAVGFPTGVWALWTFFHHRDALPLWTVWLSGLNVAAFVFAMGSLYANTWTRTALVLDRRRDRLWYMLRINPLVIMGWWIVWLIPLWLGFVMYLRGEGLVWERTEKLNANKDLIANRAALVPASAAAINPERV